MPNYAIIENNAIVNTVVAEPDYAAAQGWISLPEGAGIGWVFDGQKWDNPNKPTTEQIAENVRFQRNSILAATDWTQAADVPQATKDKWAPYRQALRDIPQQPGFPENITWPVAPDA